MPQPSCPSRNRPVEEHVKSHTCFIPGCSEEGRNQIGIRCRVAHSGASPFPNKSRTYSMFSAESDAYLCDEHALGGMAMALALTPNATEQASLAVVCGTEMTDIRTVEIKQPLTRAA
jgi:hypothetical protein